MLWDVDWLWICLQTLAVERFPSYNQLRQDQPRLAWMQPPEFPKERAGENEERHVRA